MPFGMFGNSPKSAEHTPLSTHDDNDDEEEPLPSYSDVPPPPLDSSGSSNSSRGKLKNGKKAGKNKKKAAIRIEEDTQFLHPDADFNNDYDDEEDGGDDDYEGYVDYEQGHYSPNSPHKKKKKKYYRSYCLTLLKHYLSCNCCRCCRTTTNAPPTGIAEKGSKCQNCMKRIMWMMFYLFVTLIMLLCASGIGYIVARDGSPFSPENVALDDDGNSSNGANTSGGANTSDGSGNGIQPKLPPPPPDLHSICNDWITQSGHDACSRYCTQAQCCSLPGKDSNSCWEEQAVECATYRSACMAWELYEECGGGNGGIVETSDAGGGAGGTGGGSDMGSGTEGAAGAGAGANDGNDAGSEGISGNQGGSFGGAGSGGNLLPSTTAIGKAPSYLGQICSPTSLQTPQGFESCSSLCRPSRCCHPETYGCAVEDDSFCTEYEAPCATVAESWRGSGHAVVAAEADGGVESGSGGGGGSSGGGTTGVGGASSTAVTKGSAGADTADNSNSIANQVMAVCNSNNLNPPDDCIQACIPAACCYVSTEYLPIEQLFDQYYSTLSSTSNTPISNSMRTTESCSNNIGFCQQYGACEHLNHLKDISGWDSPTYTYELDIEGVCMAEYIAQNGALECSNVCQPAHCCFSDQKPTAQTNQNTQTAQHCDTAGIDCESYAKCQVLYPVQENVEELLKVAEHIDEACSVESLGTANGRAQCQEMCDGHFCCFDTGAYGCANDPTKLCLAYAGCDNLVNTPTSIIQNNSNNNNNSNNANTANNPESEVDAFITSLESACDPTTSLKTLEGINLCHNKCQTHLCCFTTDRVVTGEDCSVKHMEACSAYSPCKNLVAPGAAGEDGEESNALPPSSTLDPETTKNIVESSCLLPENPSDITEDWVQGCHTVCASRLCCFLDPKLSSSCYNTVGKAECDMYDECSVLINDSGGEMTHAYQIANKFDGIDGVCSAVVAGGAGDQGVFTTCYDACQVRSCCFEKGAYSCYGMEKDWCEEYAACAVVGLEFDKGESPSEYTSTATTPPATTQSNAIAQPTATEQTDFLDELNAACSTENLSSLNGIRLCYKKCQTHLCCFPSDDVESEEDCTDMYDKACNAYSPCGNLIYAKNAWTPPVSYELMDIKKKVDETCDLATNAIATTQLVTECHDVCASRLCCLVDETIASNCIDTVGDEECESYTSCQVLISDETSASVSIDSVCNNNVLSDTALYAKCKEKCEERACCFGKDSGYSCYEMETDWCHEFKACDYVGMEFFEHHDQDSSSSSQSQPTSNIDAGSSGGLEMIDDICVDKVKNDSDRFNRCKEICQERSCCFVNDPAASCYERKMDWCHEFKSCDFVGLDFNSGPAGGDSTSNAQTLRNPIDAVGSVPPPTPAAQGNPQPSQNVVKTSQNAVLSTHCSPALLNDHLNECSSHCVPYECCFVQDNSCYSNNQQKCTEYSFCKSVFEFSEGKVSQPSAQNPPRPPLPTKMMSTNVEEPLPFEVMCSTSNLGKNWNDCKIKCSPYACCFSEEKSCYRANQMECDQFEICKEFQYDLAPTPSSAVGNVKNNVGAQPSATSALNPQNSEQPFETICLPSNIGQNWNACKSHCTPYECCFSHSNSCYLSNREKCEEYDSCQVFFDNDSDYPEPTISATSTLGSMNGMDSGTESFEVLCLPSKLNENWNFCRDQCSPYECCFDADDSCYDYQQPKCEDYALCEAFFHASGQETVPNQKIGDTDSLGESELIVLAKACNAEQLGKDDTECKMLCQGSQCCFDQNIGNCANSMESFCRDHSMCAGVFQR